MMPGPGFPDVSLTLYFAALAALYLLLRLREILLRRRRAAAARAEVGRGAEAVREELASWGGPPFEVAWGARSTEVTVRFRGPEGPVAVTVAGAPSREEGLREAALRLRAARLALPEPEAGGEPGAEPPARERGPGLAWWRERLGLGPEAGLDDAEAAWRRLAKESHPDVGGTAEAMASLNEAREEARRTLA